MNLMESLFGTASPFGFTTDPDAYRNQQQHAAEWQLSNAQSFNDWLLEIQRAANYRPPVHVPAGFADWYAHGDEAI